MATTKLEQLRKEVKDLFDLDNFQEIIVQLTDQVLDKHKDAELYSWKARALYRTSLNDEAISYAQKAIDCDPMHWMGYLARGTALDNKGELDNAIADYNKAIKLNPKYAVAYNNRGNAWHSKGELDKAIDDYNIAIKLNPKYADAYDNRGNAWADKEEFDKAIDDHNKAINLNPKDALAYNNRGNAWADKEEFDKAIDDYNMAIMLDPKHASAYNNRGSVWHNNKGELDKAINDYNKALELNPTYAHAIYNLALIFKQRGDLGLALEKFEQLKSMNRFLNDVQWQISDIKDTLSAKITDEVKNDIEKIKNIVNAIRLKSLAGKEAANVVHYSKLSVADIITNSPASRMHYSNVIYMNDPQEGKVFIEYLADNDITEWFERSSYKNESTIFLGSFLPATDTTTGDSDPEDQLLLWRTYGRDEAGVDAGGCNLVIDTSFFNSTNNSSDDPESKQSGKPLPSTLKKIIAAIEQNNKFLKDTRNSLLNVQYIRKNKIINDQDGIISGLVDYLKTEIKKLIAKNKQEEANIDAKLYTDSKIFDALMELCHLFKSADYSFEKEVRVIRTESRNSENILYYKDLDGKEPKPPKHFYVRSDKRILPYIRKIYLGPKVKNSSHWSLHLDYSLRKSAKREDDEIKQLAILEKKLAGKTTLTSEETKQHAELKQTYSEVSSAIEKIKPNEIDIIPSKCRFV